MGSRRFLRLPRVDSCTRRAEQASLDGISSILATLHTPQILRCAQSIHSHVRFLLDWGGAQIGNKIEGNTESSNSAIQFSVFVFGIVRRIRRSRGRHLEHLRATLRARALVFQRSAGVEYSKLLLPVLLHGIATLIFNLWSSYRSSTFNIFIDKQMRYKAPKIPSKFKLLAGCVILLCSSTCN